MTLDKVTKSHILQLQAASKEHRLVIFVGAGASASAGAPVWNELIERLKEGLPEDISDSHDMLKIAQLYRELRGEVEYQKEVKKILKFGQISSNKIHEVIMNLNPCHIVTTNYDDLLEQSAVQNNKQYYVVAKDEDLSKNQGEKMLIKMHGDFNEGNIVLTENDYFDYSRNFPLIRSFVLSLFSTKVILFVGFSFEDINLKYIIRQIASVLGDNMQRAYLLVDQPRNALSHSYFQKKGIQLLCLPYKLTSSVLKVQKATFSNDGLREYKSIALNQSLNLICSYDQYYEDLASRTINFFETYGDQIKFWGQYLEFLFPGRRRKEFHISQQNLTLPEGYSSWLSTIFENEETSKAFKDKYGDRLEWLINKLVDNRIIYVNDKKILNPAEIEKYEERETHGTINLIHSLAFEEIEQRLKFLRQCSLKYTIEDLELPYLLFKLGNYNDAYHIYKQLAPEMWRRRKYVLYFICLYNIEASYGRVLMEIVNKNKRDEYQNLIKEVRKINLKEILKDLPVELHVRNLLEELVDNGMLMKSWIASARLNDKIYSQRKNAEQGGWSINSDIIDLLDNYDQSFYFCNKNYILNECYTYWQEANKKVAEGIINSIMTPENHKWQSKLDELLVRNVPLFVFMLKPEVLGNTLRNLTDGSIHAEKKFVEALNILVINLVKAIRLHREIANKATVACYLKNIILMFNYIDGARCVPNIYIPIMHFWYVGRYAEFAQELMKLLNRQPPTAKEAIKLIDCALHSETLSNASGKGIEEYISELAKIARDGGEILNDFVSIEQITVLRNVVLESSFLLAIPKRFQVELIKYIREHVDNVYDLCLVEYYTNAHVITPELIERLKDKVSKYGKEDYLREARACNLLYQFACQDAYSELREAIDVFKTTNKCYQFISAPLGYENIEDVNNIWVEHLRDEELKELLDNSKTRQIITKKFSEDSLRNKIFKERAWNLMK